MADTPAKPKPHRLRSLLRWIRNVLAAIGAVLIVYHLFFDLSMVVSPSMSPTLRGDNATNGDWVLSERLTYRLRSPHRWELIQFRGEDGNSIMKRAVGLPGETIGLHDGRPVINGTMVEPPSKLQFLHYYEFGPQMHNGKQAECKDGYFVLGDDSKDSQDSRYEGPINASRIIGRPCLIVWPWSRVGWVNP